MQQAYPYLLERGLNSRMQDRTYEIINSGVPGYSTFQQLRYLEKRGLSLKPDAIIVQFCLNDVVERYKVLFEYGGDNVFLGVDTRENLQGVHGWLVRNSRAYEALARLTVSLGKAKQEYDVSQLMSDDLSPKLEQAWKLVLLELDTIHQIAKRNEIPLMLMIAPYRRQLGEPELTNQPQRRLIDFASERKLATLNLLLDFSMFVLHQNGTKLFNDANHFSVQGHQLAAIQMIDPVIQFLETNLKPSNQ